MNTRTFFCNHLADWLYEEEWHFTTLLAVCIESVENLPDDANVLIDKLLSDFPERPPKEKIANFLRNSPRVRLWFRQRSPKPKIVRFNLQAQQVSHSANARLSTLSTTSELAEWLDITCGQLDWLADLRRHDSKTPAYLNHYHYSFANKRDGGVRLIESPKSLLKSIQRKINDEILSTVAIHDAAHGFRKGRSCKTHATLHAGKRYVFLFDLAHCFHSINWLNAHRIFIGLGYSPTATRYLTGLCTHKSYSGHELLHKLDIDQRLRLHRRHLPQGAPSSPALSNAVLFRLDKRLTGLAKSLGLEYSRYADDSVPRALNAA